MASAPEKLLTERLLLRRPLVSDAEAIFSNYASDDAIGRYIAWPIHQSVDDSQAFLRFSESEWGSWPAGPYLMFSRDNAVLLGSTGLDFESATVATTGYVLAREYWGKGYATEAVRAMANLAGRLGVQELYAMCHVEHVASQRVLEKGGFRRGALEKGAFCFPNLSATVLQDVYRFSMNPAQR